MRDYIFLLIFFIFVGCDVKDTEIPSLAESANTFVVTDSLGQFGINLLYELGIDTIRLESGPDDPKFSLSFRVWRSPKATILNIKSSGEDLQNVRASIFDNTNEDYSRVWQSWDNVIHDSITPIRDGFYDIGLAIVESSLGPKKFNLNFELFTEGLEDQKISHNYVVVLE